MLGSGRVLALPRYTPLGALQMFCVEFASEPCERDSGSLCGALPPIPPPPPELAGVVLRVDLPARIGLHADGDGGALRTDFAGDTFGGGAEPFERGSGGDGGGRARALLRRHGGGGHDRSGVSREELEALIDEAVKSAKVRS